MKRLALVSPWLLLAVSGPTWADEPAVVKAVGTVEPKTVVDVSSTMAGILVKLGTEPGDASKAIGFGSQVSEGAVLAEFDGTTSEMALSQAKAELHAALTEIELAKAQLAQAERELDRTQKRVADKSADSAAPMPR